MGRHHPLPSVWDVNRRSAERRIVRKLKVDMPARVTVFRVAAVIILLLTGVELIACEVLSPATCEISGAPGDKNPDSGDACLCCCFHVVVVTPIVFETNPEVVALDPPPTVGVPSIESAGIYHPPRA